MFLFISISDFIVCLCVNFLQDLQLNRVTMEETTEKTSHLGAKPRKKSKTFDLSAGDKFWMQYKGR